MVGEAFDVAQAVGGDQHRALAIRHSLEQLADTEEFREFLYNEFPSLAPSKPGGLNRRDLLVTSGTDGIFPRGLTVGKVTQIRRSPQGLFQDATVVPAVDVTRIEEVVVLTSGRTPDVLPAALAPGPTP